MRGRCSYHCLNQTWLKECGAMSVLDGGLAIMAKNAIQFICRTAETKTQWMSWYMQLNTFLEMAANHHGATSFPSIMTTYILPENLGKYSPHHHTTVTTWMENNILKNSDTLSLYSFVGLRTFGQVATVCESEMHSAKATGRLSRTAHMEDVGDSELR